MHLNKLLISEEIQLTKNRWLPEQFTRLIYYLNRTLAMDTHRIISQFRSTKPEKSALIFDSLTT